MQAWLSERYGGEVSVTSCSVLEGGFDYDIFSMQFAGEGLPAEWSSPVVARVQPLAERYPALQRETEIQRWCTSQGYPTARPIALLPPGEVVSAAVQVIEHLPGQRMDRLMASRPWRVPGLVALLGRLLAALHRLPIPDFVSSDDDTWSLVERRLALVRYLIDEYDDKPLAAALAKVERLLPRLRVSDPALCHGDFHPLNVIVDGSAGAVIDWTDAGIGDRHGDVARTMLLLRIAAIAAPRPAERALMRMVGPGLARGFLRAYRQELTVDMERLRLWTPIHLLHGWAQIRADQAEVFGPTTAGTRYRSGLDQLLQRRLEVSMLGLGY